MKANIAAWNGSAYVPKPVDVIQTFEIVGRKVFTHKEHDGSPDVFAMVYRVSEWESGACMAMAETEDIAMWKAKDRAEKKGADGLAAMCADCVSKWGVMNREPIDLSPDRDPLETPE